MTDSGSELAISRAVATLEVRVATVIPLDIGMDSPVFGLLEFFNDEGIGVGVGLDMAKEPGRKGVGDMVVIDAGGGI